MSECELNILVSSAKRINESNVELLGISLTYNKNNNGPNTKPWDTPHEIVFILDRYS